MAFKKKWRPIIDIFQSKLSIWKDKTMSFGGRFTLIKSVLYSLTIYSFALFKAQNGIIYEHEKMRRRFLWSGSDSTSRIHWASRSKVVASKKDGGIGVKTLKA